MSEAHILSLKFYLFYPPDSHFPHRPQLYSREGTHKNFEEKETTVVAKIRYRNNEIKGDNL